MDTFMIYLIPHLAKIKFNQTLKEDILQKTDLQAI